MNFWQGVIEKHGEEAIEDNFSTLSSMYTGELQNFMEIRSKCIPMLIQLSAQNALLLLICNFYPFAAMTLVIIITSTKKNTYIYMHIHIHIYIYKITYKNTLKVISLSSRKLPLISTLLVT